jgi:hypothetical protein
LLGVDAVTSGDQRPTFRFLKQPVTMMGVVIVSVFAGTFGYDRHLRPS